MIRQQTYAPKKTIAQIAPATPPAIVALAITSGIVTDSAHKHIISAAFTLHAYGQDTLVYQSQNDLGTTIWTAPGEAVHHVAPSHKHPAPSDLERLTLAYSLWQASEYQDWEKFGLAARYEMIEEIAERLDLPYRHYSAGDIYMVLADHAARFEEAMPSTLPGCVAICDDCRSILDRNGRCTGTCDDDDDCTSCGGSGGGEPPCHCYACNGSGRRIKSYDDY